MKNPLEIIHEEEGFVVICKASGFLSVPGRGPDKQDAVSSRIREMYPACIVQPSVHRLDMDTSGLMLLALDKETHRALSIQFQERQVGKVYYALLEGHLKEENGRIELPFRLDPDNRPYQLYDEVHGKMGLTHWERIAYEGDYTRVRFEPHTGRTHQLRLHASHEKGLGIPIVGDRLYGNGTEPGQLRLHAAGLSFDHPLSGRRLEFESQPPW